MSPENGIINVDALKVPGPAKYDLVSVDDKTRKNISFTMRPRTIDFIGSHRELLRKKYNFEKWARSGGICLYRGDAQRWQMLLLQVQ